MVCNSVVLRIIVGILFCFIVGMLLYGLLACVCGVCVLVCLVIYVVFENGVVNLLFFVLN